MDQNIDSYSGFFDNGKMKATGMGDYLKGRGVTNVYVAGLAGDFCVNFTAVDALDLGFKSIIIEDATRPIDAQNFKNVLEEFKIKGGEILSSNAIKTLSKK